MCGAVAAFETEKKKALVRIFHWRPDMHGYYHSAGAQDAAHDTILHGCAYRYSVHHRRGQDSEKR